MVKNMNAICESRTWLFRWMLELRLMEKLSLSNGLLYGAATQWSYVIYRAYLNNWGSPHSWVVKDANL